MATVYTAKYSILINDTIIAAPDIDRLTVDERIGNNLPGVLDNTAKRGSRNAHTLTGIFMRQALQI
jgi:hypothetical protein